MQLVFVSTRPELIRRHVENKEIMKLWLCRFLWDYDGLWKFDLVLFENHNCSLLVRVHCFWSGATAREWESAEFHEGTEIVKIIFLKRMKTCCLSALICRRIRIFYGLALTLRTILPDFLYILGKKTTTNLNQFVSLKLKVIARYCGRFRYSARLWNVNVKSFHWDGNILQLSFFSSVTAVIRQNNAFDLA
jgi:hypothetical protein